MMKTLSTILVSLILCLPLPGAWAQSPPSDAAQAKPQTKPRYANMPDEAVPYRRFTKPYKEWYTDPNTLEYGGAAQKRADGDISKISEVAIGFLGPLEKNPESIFGIPMLRGAQLAMEEGNARGGYKGRPFALKVHNDAALWGASSTEIVKMLYDENCWGMLGSIDGQSTHVALRLALKIEMPIVDTGTTDPTVTETRIQWLLHNFPDDRQQSYALAEYVFKTLKLKRVGVLRTQTRYARLGVVKFNDEARRMGRPPVLEVKFERGDTEFSKQLRMLQDARIDALVIWGEATEAGQILKQMRAMGMTQPVFAGSRVAYPELLQRAGTAAEGLVATVAMDPTREEEKWQAFQTRYRQKFNEDPDPYAAYAYDGMNILIAAIQKAGLNRGRIMEALRDYQTKEYGGVADRVKFDRTLNNVAPITLAQVRSGKFVYWKAQARQDNQNSLAENR
jgi:branched-chain amino acid transport system substrate-binding protein